MKERDVESAFVRFLLDRGWDVSVDNPDRTDVIATRGTERLVAEVKRTTTSPGLDVDTGYGQLLRRMDDPGARYALVVPARHQATAARVPARVRRALDITVFLVDEDGQVVAADE